MIAGRAVQWVALLVLLCMAALEVNSSSFEFINVATGFGSVDYAGNPLTVNGAHDANWLVQPAGSHQVAPAQAVQPTGGDFGSGWAANDNSSVWVAVNASTSHQPIGTSTYTRTFQLPPNVQLSTVSLTAGLDCDDNCILSLNGVVLASYNRLITDNHNMLPVHATSNFIAGANALTVLNTGNGTTDAVRLVGTVSYVGVGSYSPLINTSAVSSITDVTGWMLAWSANPVGGGWRGCPAAYELTGPGTGASLTLMPCDVQTTVPLALGGAAVDLSMYGVVTNLIQASTDHSLYYAVLAPVPHTAAAAAGSLLATFSQNTGAVLQLLAIPVQYSPVSLLMDAELNVLYLVVRTLSAPGFLSIITLNPTATSWVSAATLMSTWTPDVTIVPANTALVVRGASGSAALVSAGQLVLLVGSVVVSAPLTTAAWHLVTITASTAAWFEIKLSDTTVLAADSLSLTALASSRHLLISSAFSVYVADLTTVTVSTHTATTTRLHSVQEHLQRAKVALGCGQVALSVDVLPAVVPALNSSLPYAALLMWAQPSLLSAVTAPFWYMLFVDPVLDVVTYSSIEQPPLYLDVLIAPPTVTTVQSTGNALGYSATNGASLRWIGSDFDQGALYSCQTATSSTAATYIDSTSLVCALPLGLPADPSNGLSAASGGAGWIQVQLLFNGVFQLYQSRLLVVNRTTATTNVSSSSLKAPISRMVVSYSVSASVTPSPVVGSALSSSVNYAPITTAAGQSVRMSPLQLHASVTRGLTYVAQQVMNLSYHAPTTQPSSVVPQLTAALSQSNWANTVGLGDAYAVFAMAGSGGSLDFTNMASSASAVLSQDASSLPQILTGLGSYGSAASLALDTIGSQAQSWLEDNVDIPDSSEITSVLSGGAILPDISTSALQQLTSLGVNSLLQAAGSNSLISSVLSDAGVSSLLSLPDDLSAALDDPADFITSLLPSGPLKDIALTLVDSIGDDFSTIAGSAGDIVDGFVANLGDSFSDVAGSLSDFGSSFLDDIAGDALSGLADGGFAGPVGALAGMLAGDLGVPASITKFITAGIDLGGGVAEIFSGDVIGGIGDVVSGIASLFGGSSGPDETQLLGQQLASDMTDVMYGLGNLSVEFDDGFNALSGQLYNVSQALLMADQQLYQQITLGFTQVNQEINASTLALSNEISSVYSALSNLTISGFTQLQQQEYIQYSGEMQQLSAIISGMQSLTLSVEEVLTELSAIQDSINTVIEDEQQIARLAVMASLHSYMAAVTDAVQESQLSSSSLLGGRVILPAYLTQYTSNMAEICSWATVGSADNAAAPFMSGDTSKSPSTWSQQVDLSGHYDLLVALLPGMLGQYLGIHLPSTLPTTLPNPVAWAFAANFWLEARQAALQTPNADQPCVQNLWQVGQGLQVAIRLAVAPSTLNAAHSMLVTQANQLQTSVLALTGGIHSLSAKDWISLLTAHLPFAAFDEACAVSKLLLSLAKASGLGGNGFNNGFVSSGQAAEMSSDDVVQNFQPGQPPTSIAPFSTISDSADFLIYLSLNLNSSVSNISATTVANLSSNLLHMTTWAMQNAISFYYCPCAPTAAVTPYSLPIVDTTLRRLAGYMMQNHISFSYQGTTVSIPAPKPLISLAVSAPVPSSTATSHAATSAASAVTSPPSAGLVSGALCMLMYGLPGSVDYPWSTSTAVTFLYSPSLVTTSAGAAVAIASGSGVRTFTNRFGASFSVPFTIAAPAANTNNLLFLGSSAPFDGNGLAWQLSTAVQLPGAGPSVLFSLLGVHNSSYGIAEGASGPIDSAGSAFLSSVPGFSNVTIPASNVNALAANYGACQAPITFTNGLRAPTQPSSFNGNLHISFSYFISDGATYAVTTNLSITTTSAFASLKDQLGNPYQSVVSVTGQRTYTYLPTGASLTSQVSSASVNPPSTPRFYPYALLSSAPGVYSENTAPFLDAAGITFTVTPPAPSNGNNVGVGPQYSSTSIALTSANTTVLLNEAYFIHAPALSYQQQLYII